MLARTPLTGRLHALNSGLQVRRLLPAAQRRAVGPFIFLDHFGPVTLAADVDSDVGPHPHTGLATVTYLFDGRQVHRDSLGTVQTITPGAVNWMTAGRGIVHSERTHPDDRGRARPAHGLQMWVGLPADQADGPPAFQHLAAADVPQATLAAGVQARVLVGQAFGLHSPVHTATPTLLVDLQLPPLQALDLPALADELAVYAPTQGLGVTLAGEEQGQPLAAATLLPLPAGQGARLQAGPDGARLVVLGGCGAQPAAAPVVELRGRRPSRPGPGGPPLGRRRV